MSAKYRFWKTILRQKYYFHWNREQNTYTCRSGERCLKLFFQEWFLYIQNTCYCSATEYSSRMLSLARTIAVYMLTQLNKLKWRRFLGSTVLPLSCPVYLSVCLLHYLFDCILHTASPTTSSPTYCSPHLPIPTLHLTPYSYPSVCTAFTGRVGVHACDVSWSHRR